MIEKGRISSRQGSMLLISAIIGSIFLFLPRFALEITKTDSGIALTGALIISLAYLFILFKLLFSFPEENIFQISQKVMGKYLGSLVNLLLIAGTLAYAATVVRSMGEFFITLILPETPLSVFIVAMLFLAALAAGSGIEAIARLNEFWLPIILFSFILIFLGALPEFELFRLRPLFSKADIPDILLGTLDFTNTYIQFGILIFIFPYIKDKDLIKRNSVISIIITWLFLVTTVMVTIGVFGKDLTRYYVWPTLELARNISVAHFFERMEALFVVIWLLLAFIKISIWVYAGSLGLRQTFNLKRQTWVPFVAVVAVYYLSFIPDNMPEVLYWIKLWEINGLGLVFGVAIPMSLFLVAKIRGKGVRKNAKKNSNNATD